MNPYNYKFILITLEMDAYAYTLGYLPNKWLPNDCFIHLAFAAHFGFQSSDDCCLNKQRFAISEFLISNSVMTDLLKIDFSFTLVSCIISSFFKSDMISNESLNEKMNCVNSCLVQIIFHDKFINVWIEFILVRNY